MSDKPQLGFHTKGVLPMAHERPTSTGPVETARADPRLLWLLRMVVTAPGAIELIVFPTQLQVISELGTMVIGLGNEEDLHVDYLPPRYNPGPPVNLFAGCAAGGGFVQAMAGGPKENTDAPY